MAYFVRLRPPSENAFARHFLPAEAQCLYRHEKRRCKASVGDVKRSALPYGTPEASWTLELHIHAHTHAHKHTQAELAVNMKVHIHAWEIRAS